MTIISTIDVVNKAASFSFYTNNIITSSFTLNPLTSMITATALNSSVVTSYNDHTTNLLFVTKWSQDVQTAFPLNNYAVHAATQTYNKNNNQTSDAEFLINGYSFNISYSNPQRQFTVAPRLATTFQWGEFLFYLNFHNNFISQINTNYP